MKGLLALGVFALCGALLTSGNALLYTLARRINWSDDIIRLVGSVLMSPLLWLAGFSYASYLGLSLFAMRTHSVREVAFSVLAAFFIFATLYDALVAHNSLRALQWLGLLLIAVGAVALNWHPAR